MVKVSVIVPIYNSEETLDRCISSLVNQTLEDIEIILINDGSTDNSLEIANKFKEQFNNIYIINRENRGISASRNEGIELSRGKYIGFVDSDDYVDSDMYEKLYNSIKECKADIAVCDYRVLNNQNALIEEIHIKEKTDNIIKNPKILNEMHFVPWNKLYKKDLFKDIRFPIGVKYEDLNTIIKVFYKATKVSKADECLYNYILNETGETLTVDNRIFDIYIILEDILNYVNENGSTDELHQELEKLCVNKIQLYFISSYNLEHKNDMLDFSNKGIDFLDKNFKGWRKKYIRQFKNLKDLIIRVIKSNKFLHNCYIKLK